MDAGRALTIREQLTREFRVLVVALAGTCALIAVIVLLILGAITPQLDTAIDASNAVREANIGLLDQETGLRGYLLTQDPLYLQPYYQGVQETAAANEQLVNDRLDAVTTRDYVQARLAEQSWSSAWAQRAATPSSPPLSGAALSAFNLQGKQLFDTYRSADTRLLGDLNARRQVLLDAERNSLIGGLVIELAILIAVMLTTVRARRRLTRGLAVPIARLTGAVQRMGSGNFDAIEPLEGPAEIQHLREGTNEMAASLRTAHEHIVTEQAATAAEARKLSLILEMARDVGGSLSLKYVLAAVQEMSVRIAGGGTALIWQTGEGGLYLALGGDSGASPGDLVRQSAAYGQAPRYERAAQGSHAAIPMVFGGRVIGVLELHGVPDLADDDIPILETLARHAASSMAAAQMYESTEEVSRIDALTGLPNRRQLDLDLDVECGRAERYGRPLAFVMMDVDHFKAFNDTMGHPAGDAALSMLGALLRDGVRTSDSAYRYGGEEFCLVLRETDAVKGREVVERLRQRVEQSYASAQTPLTVSIGLADTAESELASPQALIAAADRALYLAKGAGRNRVVVASRNGPGESAAADDAANAG
jgi:diguanylate cyclase (GGDEF)-like protein